MLGEWYHKCKKSSYSIEEYYSLLAIKSEPKISEMNSVESLSFIQWNGAINIPSVFYIGSKNWNLYLLCACLVSTHYFGWIDLSSKKYG